MNTESRHALIVDPDAVWRNQLSRRLSDESFRCETAADGQHATELLDTRAFDLLLTELVLPKIHGHALIVQTLNRVPSPRVVVLSSLSDARLARDVLSRGADDYLHKSTPTELLVTKILSLFNLRDWQAQQVIAGNTPKTESREVVLNRIERRLQSASDHFAEHVAPLFEQDYYVAEIPSGVLHFAERMCLDERAAIDAQLHVAANTRQAERVDIRVPAVAIQVNEELMAVDAPVEVVLLDVSTSGVRLMHTRALPATDLVLSWQAQTIPYCTIRLPLSITRCRPVGRFYDIGGMFDIPPEV